MKTILITTAHRYLLLVALTLATAASAFAQPRVYVVNNGSSTLSVISTETRTVVGTIPVGPAPTGIAVAPDEGFVYVAHLSGKSISVVDASVSLEVATIPLTGTPAGMAFTPDGRFLYVTLADIATVAIIDTADNAVVASVPTSVATPYAIAMTPDGAYAYVAHRWANTISVISTASQQVVTRIGGVGGYMAGLATITIPADGRFAYATSSFFYDVYVIDLETNRLSAKVRLPGTGSGSYGGGLGSPIAVTAADGRIYAADSLGHFVSIYDLATQQLLTTIRTTNSPRDVAVTPDGAFAYVTGTYSASRSGDEITVIDAATLTVVDSIDVGYAPGALAMASAVASRGPFGRFARSLPGRIEAEDYDQGGEGVGYHDETEGNEGLSYRTDNVDIKESAEGGHAVGWMHAGEWLAYTADIQATGLYTIQARVGSALAGRTFHIEVDGVDVTGPMLVPELPDWDLYDTVNIPDVPLEAGRRQVRVVAGPLDYMDLQWIAFAVQTNDASAGPFSGTPIQLPGRIEAENYDRGGPEVGYRDTTPGNEQGFAVYRTDDVDLKVSREGGHTVGWLAAGEWLSYTVEAPRTVSTMLVRIGSALPGRTFHLEIDGRDVTGTVAVPQVPDWDSYQTIRISNVPVLRGIHTVRFVMGPEDFVDLQWIAFR